jgi:ATP-dependent exoDNAse (exonuclease V) alpha subunit
MSQQRESPGAGGTARGDKGSVANSSAHHSARSAPRQGSWSPQQEAALKAVLQWHRARNKQVFRLFGYAGTGKTTLARHFAEGIEGQVAFAAFTGKAAYVMRSKGCSNATTIHNLIYRLEKEDENGNPIFIINPDSYARRTRLIVIDEVSMVNEKIGRDLLRFGVPIIVIGDPAQLPPVEGGGFFTTDEPDFMLTEIHRQARDSPIIKMATIVREGGRLAVGDYGDGCRVVNLHDYEVVPCDQILVGRNVTRRNINSGLREGYGRYGTYPLSGDKLVCLRNDYRRGFLNGSLCIVEQVIKASDDGPIVLRVVPEEGGAAVTATTHAGFFNGRPIPDPREYVNFDFGYALTVHKAQGSQWDDVLLHGEAHCFGADAHRWLYTGLTRAAKRITVIRR